MNYQYVGTGVLIATTIASIVLAYFTRDMWPIAAIAITVLISTTIRDWLDSRKTTTESTMEDHSLQLRKMADDIHDLGRQIDSSWGQK